MPSRLLVGAACIALWSCGGQPAPPVRDDATRAPTSPPFTAAQFAELQPRYLHALDQRLPPRADPNAIAAAMEAELHRDVRALETSQAPPTAADAERAGLVYIYAALFVMRDNALVDSGWLDGRTLDPAISAGERRTTPATWLSRAQRLRPHDGRIASWLAGAEAASRRGPHGELTTAATDQLLAAVDALPTFNLWTAFIAMRGEPIDSPAEVALFAKTQAFVAARTCRDVAPGSADARNCRSGPLAPFNTQAAVVMLADQYLHRGEAALRRGDVPTAMPLLGTARGVLATLDSDELRDATHAWNNEPALTVRRERLDVLHPGGALPDESFWHSDAYDAVYACAACHVK